MARSDELLAALGGRTPIAGVTGVGTERTWDAVVSAHSPTLTGDAVTFTALEDGTLVVDQDVPADSLAPIAEALEDMVAPPYRAAAAKAEGDNWTAVAESVRIAQLPGVDADLIDLTVVDGERTLTADGEVSTRPLPALDDLAAEHDSVALHAERVDGDLYAVDVFPL
ncbi:MAG TPA: hypothetical protein VJM06_05220 [Gaiellaceae bacterium]|nr:hypothetical protein [Gaiellaceae bacterium]